MPPDDEHLRQLMHQACGGNHEAFGALAAATQDELYHLALAQGLTAADAAEAVQETLLRAYQGRRRWRPLGSIPGWLCGITLNVCREFSRTRRRQPMANWDPVVLEQLAATSAEAGESLQGVQEAMAALQALPQRQREALTLRYLQGLSVRQTAEAMNCAEGTVKAAVFAALASLRKTMTSKA